MVAYSYKKRFVPRIKAGLKRQTMRNDRKRHARPGEEIQNYYAQRTKQCELLCKPTCRAVTPVRIDFKRDLVKIEGRPHVSGRANLDAFAVLDGFANWDDLKAFWREEHASLTSWSGVLIEW